MSACAVRSTVSWSKSTTGSRLLVWLQADRSALAVRGRNPAPWSASPAGCRGRAGRRVRGQELGHADDLATSPVTKSRKRVAGAGSGRSVRQVRPMVRWAASVAMARPRVPDSPAKGSGTIATPSPAATSPSMVAILALEGHRGRHSRVTEEPVDERAVAEAHRGGHQLLVGQLGELHPLASAAGGRPARPGPAARPEVPAVGPGRTSGGDREVDGGRAEVVDDVVGGPWPSSTSDAERAGGRAQHARQ